MMATPEALDAAESVPQVLPVQPAPASVHVTPLFCASLDTVAVKLLVCPTCTVALVGATTTETGAVIVMVTALVRVPSAIEVAVSVTVAGLGMFAGAL